MKTRVIHPLAVAILVASAAAATAAQQGGPMRGADLDDRVFRYWENSVGAHDMGGRFISGMGAAGSSATHMSVNLVSGKHYVFTLFCDINCTDSEIRALGANNMPIESDAETPLDREDGIGAEAEIAFNATQDGPVTLEVKVNACSTASCSYMIGTFASR